MGPFKKKKYEKQRLLSDEYGDDDQQGDQQFSTADDFDIQPSKGAEDGFDIRPSNGAKDDFDIQPAGEFEMQFASAGEDAFDDSGDPSPFGSLDPFASSAESGFPSSADPDFSSGDPVDPSPKTKEDDVEEFDFENFQPKDLGTFGADEPFELVVKDLDKERELLEKGEDPKGAILVDFPSAKPQEKEEKPEPEAAPARKGRRMRRFSLGAKPSEDITDKNGGKDPQPFVEGLGEFQASFSALALEIGDAQDFDADGKKKKKGVTIFRKGKESETKKSIGRSAEIVVDKSKIPTQKVAPGIKDGELFIGHPSHCDGEELAAEKGKKSGRLKSLAFGLKKKVAQSTRHLQESGQGDSEHGDSGHGDSGHGDSAHGDSGHGDSDVSDNDEEGMLGRRGDDSKEDVDHEEAEATERRPVVRTRRRVTVSATGPDGAAQRTRLAARRVRSDTSGREESERRRSDRAHRTKSDSVVKKESERSRPDRAHRKSTGDRPSRQSILEQHHLGAHGQRLSHRSRNSEQDDSNAMTTLDSSHQGEESVASAESGKQNEGGARQGGESVASAESGKQIGGHMSGSSRTGDAGKHGGRHVLMTKAKSRRTIDPLSASCHHDKPPGRRVPASDALKRRAMSTRQLVVAPPPNDTVTRSSLSNPKTNSPYRSNSGGDHKKSLSRKYMSERHLGGNGKNGRPVLKAKTGDSDPASPEDDKKISSDDGGMMHGWIRNINNAGSQQSSYHSRGSCKEMAVANADHAESTEGGDGRNLAASDSENSSSHNRSLKNNYAKVFLSIDASSRKGAESTEGGDGALNSSEAAKVPASDSESSSSHSRSLKNDYARVFLSIDASSRNSDLLRDESRQESMRDDSKHGSMREESRRTMVDESGQSMKDGSKRRSSTVGISNVLSKLEEAKARTQEMARSRAKTQIAK